MAVFETDDFEMIRDIAQALGGRVRNQICRLLAAGPRNINEIAAALQIPLPTATVNVKQLEEAGIIAIEQKPGKRGMQKICSLKYSRLHFHLGGEAYSVGVSEVIEMPVGNFINADIEPPCGICTPEQQIGRKNDIRVFYSPERIDAQLLWFTRGRIEYRFPNPLYGEADAEELELTAELCTEVPYFNNNAKAEIKLQINGIDLPSWISPGDFGGRKGRLTPKWWGVHKTQFGMLVSWKLATGWAECNGERTTGIGIRDFSIDQAPFISAAFVIDQQSSFKGGMNLFGRGFGNYSQDIVMRIKKSPENSGHGSSDYIGLI